MVVAIYNACFTSMTLSPILLGGYADKLHVSPGAVGTAISVENFAYAGGLLLLAGFVKRFPDKLVLTAALAIMTAMSLLTALATNVATLMMFRACYGLAVGLCTSVVVERFSKPENAQRTWSLANFAHLLYAFSLLLVGGAVATRWGVAGVCLLMAAIFVGCLVCGLALSPSVREPRAVTAKPKSASGFPRLAVLCGVAALFFVNAGHQTLWAFQERMGERTDLARPAINFILAVSVWGAVFGTVAILLLGERFGRRWPNVFCYIVLLASAYLLSTPNSVAYISGAVLVKAAWFFSLPMITGALTLLDRSGRASATGLAMMTFGASFGPAVGSVVARAGMPVVCLLAGGFYLISFIATLPLLWPERREPEAA